MISKILYNGIRFNPQKWSISMNEEDLLKQVNQLFEVLREREVDYLLVGGIALLSYIEGRNTQDIDLIIDRSRVDELPELSINEENQDFARAAFGKLQVDLLLTRNPLFRLVKQKFSVDQELGSQTIRCATPTGLIILKLYALPSLYRQGEFSRADLYEGDIFQILLNYEIELDPVFKILQSHLIASDVENLKQIAQEIQTRIDRRKRQFD